ncbi:MAG: OmpA family protein [Inquilinaceae bacterium]
MHTPNGQRLIRFGGALTTGAPILDLWTSRLCLAGLGLAGLGLVAAVDAANAQIIIGGNASERPAVEVDLSVLDSLDGRDPPARITLTPPRSPAARTAPQAVAVAAAPLWMPPLPGQKPALSEPVTAPVALVATAPATSATVTAEPRVTETVSAEPTAAETVIAEPVVSEPALAAERPVPSIRPVTPAMPLATPEPAEPVVTSPGSSGPVVTATPSTGTEPAPVADPAPMPVPSVASTPPAVSTPSVASASVEPVSPRRIDTVPHTLPTTRPPLALIPATPPRPARAPDRSSPAPVNNPVAAASPSETVAMPAPAPVDEGERQMASAPITDGSSDIPASVPIAPPVPAAKPASAAPVSTVPLPPELRVSPQIASRPAASPTTAPSAASTPLPQRAPTGRGETAIAALDRPIALPPSPPTARTAPATEITAPAPSPTAETVAEPQPADPVQTASLPTPNQAGSPGSSLTIDTLPDGQGFRIMFDADEEDLNESGANLLEGLAQRMMNNDSIRLQILSFAGGTPETASQARRLSLNRALNVRTFLIDRGVRRTRIDVRALGNTAPDDPKNRVDLLLSS